MSLAVRLRKFTAEKTGASTNITSAQITAMPTVSRAITDVTRLSPYGGNGMTFAGRDGRRLTSPVDGANFNNDFGLSEKLPGGGNPISLEAIEEVQVVISPFDVRQTDFIGGGVNAITKSGTNTFKGSAYIYHQNENLRGDAVDREAITGARAKDSKTTYGFTLGGPILKDKLFLFVNGEMVKTPTVANRWRASEDGSYNANDYLSRTTLADMAAVSQHVKDKYGYDTGSWTDFPPTRITTSCWHAWTGTSPTSTTSPCVTTIRRTTSGTTPTVRQWTAAHVRPLTVCHSTRWLSLTPCTLWRTSFTRSLST